MSNCVALSDMRDNVKYQKADIDFHMVLEKNDVWFSKMYEIKVDFKISETGNFFIEQGERCWLEKTKSEIILYLDYNRELMYYLETYKLKPFVYDNKDWQSRVVSTSDFGGYTVSGLLVPYNQVIAKLNPLVEKFNCKEDEVRN